MSTKNGSSIVTAPTQFLEAGGERYPHRRFGSGSPITIESTWRSTTLSVCRIVRSLSPAR